MSERIKKTQLEKIVEMTDAQLRFLADLFDQCGIKTLFAECVKYEIENRCRVKNSEWNSHTA